MTPSYSGRPHPMSRRRLLGTIPAAMMVAWGLSACGDDADDQSAATSASEVRAGAAAASVTARFPRTVQSALGEVTIPKEPERVVVIYDADDLDPVLGAGVTPVLFGYSNWNGTGIPPWAAAAGAADAKTFDASSLEGADLELVAAAQPDLIVGMEYAVKPVQAQMNALAPALALPWNTTDFRTLQRIVGEALGREGQAEQTIATAEAAIAGAKERLKGLAGRTVTVAYAYYNASYYVHGPETPEGRMVTALGLNVRSDAGPGINKFSLERMNELGDSDIWLSTNLAKAETKSFVDSPLFTGLKAVQEGRFVIVPDLVARAVYLSSALSIAWAADRYADEILRSAEGKGLKPA
jgi:iron complex transport system substrate-binding protein